MVAKPVVLEEPRKDGFEEMRGTWADLGVGMTIEVAGRKWTIFDSAVPAQFQYGYSLWFRFRAPRGEEYTCPPRPLTKPVTILRKPGEDLPPPTQPEGAAEAALLVEALGATEIATRDERTGEVWCPDHTTHPDSPTHGDYGEGELMHLRLAHGIDTSGIEALPLSERAKAIVLAHGPLHGPKAESLAKPGQGFPHRHVPEDLSIM